MVGYAVALQMAWVVVSLTGYGQPALFYIVRRPCRPAALPPEYRIPPRPPATPVGGRGVPNSRDLIFTQNTRHESLNARHTEPCVEWFSESPLASRAVDPTTATCRCAGAAVPVEHLAARVLSRRAAGAMGALQPAAPRPAMRLAQVCGSPLFENPGFSVTALFEHPGFSLAQAVCWPGSLLPSLCFLLPAMPAQ